MLSRGREKKRATVPACTTATCLAPFLFAPWVRDNGCIPKYMRLALWQKAVLVVLRIMVNGFHPPRACDFPTGRSSLVHETRTRAETKHQSQLSHLSRETRARGRRVVDVCLDLRRAHLQNRSKTTDSSSHVNLDAAQRRQINKTMACTRLAYSWRTRGEKRETERK